MSIKGVEVSDVSTGSNIDERSIGDFFFTEKGKVHKLPTKIVPRGSFDDVTGPHIMQ